MLHLSLPCLRAFDLYLPFSFLTGGEVADEDSAGADDDDSAYLSPDAVPSLNDSQSVGPQSGSESSTRGHLQSKFRFAVRKRDDCRCVLTGEHLVQGQRNVDAAHVFGTEVGLKEVREQAGVYNVYDTTNGVLLSTWWHTKFDSWCWCPDQTGKVWVVPERVRVQERERLLQRAGSYLTPPPDGSVSLHSWPPLHLLQARFNLFCGKNEGKQRFDAPPQGGGDAGGDAGGD